jgi:hypothetical protein
MTTSISIALFMIIHIFFNAPKSLIFSMPLPPPLDRCQMAKMNRLPIQQCHPVRECYGYPQAEIVLSGLIIVNRYYVRNPGAGGEKQPSDCPWVI